MSRTRQLAAIMFTDIQGYTALMQRNEEEAIRVRDKHRRVFQAATEKHGGRILQYYGDGTLSMFDSAIDAVNCGIELQQGFREEPAIPVRIGIHAGEVLFIDEDIVGDSVNIASRIESLAVPGSVLISEKVYDEIRNQETIQVTRLKAFRLKNVETPVEVYAIANDGLVVPEVGDIAGKTEPVSEAPPSPGPVLPEGGGGSFLATKLFVPPPRPDAVGRPRLLARLNAGLSGKLTLVSAPPGFGKTTLVSEWVASCGRPVAWLSLDERDGDPRRFLCYLLSALRTIRPGLAEGVLAALRVPQPPPVESLLTSMINELTVNATPVVLVLDDYHLIDARPVDEALTFLLDHLPPAIHLAITTREDPALPLARLRVRGQLTELRAADLRFTAAEAAGFLNEAMGLALSPDAVAALEARTEGWIAGLQMAALSLRGRADAAGFIREFTGSHHFILDYLVEEVLHRQPAPVRRFLRQTAILDRLCGPLCDAVTGREGSQPVLEALERGNLFVVPLDDRRQWYRYHHLFGDVLRARAGQEHPEEMPELHRRASRWYEANGMSADAIRHALAGGDVERAAGLIERIWPEMDGTFQSAAWLRWAGALPEELIGDRPVLLAAFAWALLNEGDLEAGAARLGEAERAMALPAGSVVVDEEQFRTLPASIAIARAYRARALGDEAGAESYTRQALSLVSEEDHVLRGQASALLGLTSWAKGDLEAAHRALSDTMTSFLLAGNRQFAISVTYGLADIRITQGRLREAVRTYERSLRLVEKHGMPPPQGTADLYLGLGDLCREQGDLEAADRFFQKSEDMGAALALPDWPVRLRLAQSRLAEARGDLDGALALLDEAERLYFPNPMPQPRPIAALKARLWVRQGRLAEALAWVREQGLSTGDELSFLREFEHITLARVLLAREAADPAAGEVTRLLTRLREAAGAGGRTGHVIEILILEALAGQAREDVAGALAALTQALTLAEPEGYVRLFADEGPPMARLLAMAAARGILPGYVARLLAALRPDQEENRNPPPPPSARPVPPLVEPLSARELEILRLVARGLSNQQISERLFLALSTVKGHNRNIFDKLGVKRRTEAVARARTLGILG